MKRLFSILIFACFLNGLMSNDEEDSPPLKLTSDLLQSWNISVKSTYISFSRKSIGEIGPRAFRLYNSLDSFYLSFEAKFERIQKNAFADCPTLRRISITDCRRLTKLTESAFLGLDNLTHLTLYSNNISTLGANVFRPLKSLTYLNLLNNRIARLDSAQFLHNPRLQSVYLHFNQLSKLLPDTFSGLRLRTLWINDNQIESVSVAAFDVFCVDEFYLIRNPIGDYVSLVNNGTCKRVEFSLEPKNGYYKVPIN